VLTNNNNDNNLMLQNFQRVLKYKDDRTPEIT